MTNNFSIEIFLNIPDGRSLTSNQLVMADKDTRNLIIKSSLMLFLERGYDHVSLNQIAAKAKITKGGIYHYFSSKKDLFFEVANQFSIASETWWMTSVHRQDSFDSIKKVAREIFESLDEVPDIFYELSGGLADAKRGYFTLMLDGVRRFPELLQQREKRASQSQLAKNAEAAFLQSQEKGEVRKDITFDSFYFMLTSAVEGALIVSMLNPNIDLDKYGKEMFNLFWNGVC